MPIMFAGIEEKTYYIFGAAMLCYIPIVYCFLPETSGRTLEAMDFLFASKSPFTWDEEREFRIRMDALQTQIRTDEKVHTTFLEEGETLH